MDSLLIKGNNYIILIVLNLDGDGFSDEHH